MWKAFSGPRSAEGEGRRLSAKYVLAEFEGGAAGSPGPAEKNQAGRILLGTEDIVFTKLFKSLGQKAEMASDRSTMHRGRGVRNEEGDSGGVRGSAQAGEGGCGGTGNEERSEGAVC